MLSLQWCNLIWKYTCWKSEVTHFWCLCRICVSPFLSLILCCMFPLCLWIMRILNTALINTFELFSFTFPSWICRFLQSHLKVSMLVLKQRYVTKHCILTLSWTLVSNWKNKSYPRNKMSRNSSMSVENVMSVRLIGRVALQFYHSRSTRFWLREVKGESGH